MRRAESAYEQEDLIFQEEEEEVTAEQVHLQQEVEPSIDLFKLTETKYSSERRHWQLKFLKILFSPKAFMV